MLEQLCTVRFNQVLCVFRSLTSGGRSDGLIQSAPCPSSLKSPRFVMLCLSRSSALLYSIINSPSTHRQLTVNSPSTHRQLTVNSPSTHRQLLSWCFTPTSTVLPREGAVSLSVVIASVAERVGALALIGI